MAISFEKHHAEIIAAWKDVLDDKSSTTWALYGYEGQTNELKVVARGEGELSELCEDLNSGKIMYAFVRFEDPKTCLKKFLLINWQGEGAPILRKGTCANHIHDVATLLTGAHMTLNARNEDDIDLERVLKKLNAVGSAFNLKETRAATDEQKTPVGTNYKRVIPNKELNAAAMQDFWKKEEEEEKRRIAAEKEAKRLQQLQLEKEQRAREEKEHLEREKIVTSMKLQPAHVPIKTSPQPLSPEKTSANLQKNMTDADRMRQERNQEARELIGSRVGAAKAIFTQHTSEGQLLSKLNSTAPTKPARNSISQRINAFNQTHELVQPAVPIPTKTAKTAATTTVKQAANIAQAETIPTVVTAQSETTNAIKLEEPVKPEITANANNDDIQHASHLDDYIADNEEQYSTIKRSPHSKSNSLQSPEETSSSQATDTAVYQDQYDEEEEQEVRTKVSVTVQQSQSAKNGVINALDKMEIGKFSNEDDFICPGSIGDLGMRARALYDYQAADESEITFDPGDIITHIDQIDEGWWQGLGPDGTFGLFPANYVEIIN